MKLIIKMILAAMLLCVPFGVDAQGTITRPKKPKKQTTAPAKKQQKSLSPEQMHKKGDEAYRRNDYATALNWYLKAAEKGNEDAMWAIAAMYGEGKGVAKSPSEAPRWYNRIGEISSPRGQFYVGENFEYAHKVERNYNQAAVWYHRAAERGLPDAQYKIGMFYLKGLGVARKNYALALKWLRMAAEKGNSSAEYYLGEMYENGYGVPKDKEEAIRWYSKAADQGVYIAQEALKRLK